MAGTLHTGPSLVETSRSSTTTAPRRRLIKSSHFGNKQKSKTANLRLVDPGTTRFLRFIVERAMQGDADKLKEQYIGFKVFQRPEAYDTGVDNIVRVQAGKVREALRRYYSS